MPVVGLGTAFIVAVLADLSGDDRTRPFTRGAFAIVAMYAFGVRASDVAEITGWALNAIPL